MELCEKKLAVVVTLILVLLREVDSNPAGIREFSSVYPSLEKDFNVQTGRAPRVARGEAEPKPGEKTQSKDVYTEPENEASNESAYNEPTVDAEKWPEPGPLWDEAYQEWKWAWEFHIYLYAIVFFATGLYAGYFVVANVYDGLQSKYLSVSLNIMVTIFGFTRAFVLFLDPYHQGDIIHNDPVMRVIWSLAGPCLTSSDCLMILALIETTKISIAPPKLQKASVNVFIIFIHFALVITTDCVVSDYVEAKAMLLFCQIFFITWGAILGTANILLGYKIDKQLFSHKKTKEKADKVYIYLIHASGIANYFLCAIIAYSAFGVFGVYSDVTHVDAWPWWALQTLSRFSELLACVLIFTVSAKRTRAKKAYAQIMGSSELYPELVGKGAYLKWRLRKLTKVFKSKNKTFTTEKGSQVSLFTALREMALTHVTGDQWDGTNPVPCPNPNRDEECWVETKTMCSIIHVPAASDSRASSKPAEFHDVKNPFESLKQEKGYLELELKHVRRRSMFSALQEAKTVNAMFALHGKTASHVEETDCTGVSDDDDARATPLPNQTVH